LLPVGGEATQPSEASSSDSGTVTEMRRVRPRFGSGWGLGGIRQPGSDDRIKLTDEFSEFVSVQP
jgi:hypothetical protein